MTIQTTNYFDSTSLLMVKAEIENTLKQLEHGISALIEDGVVPFGLDDTLTNLQQCSHVLALVGHAPLAELTERLERVVQKVIHDVQHATMHAPDVDAISEATATIQRYIEFLCIHEADIPRFLMPAFNRLQIALKESPYREGRIMMPYLETLRPNIKFEPLPQLTPSSQVQRLYRFALLHLLQSKATSLDYRAMSLCGQYLAQAAQGSASAQYWSMVHVVLGDLEHTLINEPRLRVLIQIEQQIAQVLDSPQDFCVKLADYADVLMMIVSKDNDLAQDIKTQLHIHDDIISDNEAQLYTRQLFGPDLATVKTVTELLTQQLHDISTKFEHGLDLSNPDNRHTIYQQMYDIAQILYVINLSEAAQRLENEAKKLLNQNDLAKSIGVERLMNSMLFATNQLEIWEHHYSPRLLKYTVYNQHINLTKLEQAQQALCTEARAALETICTALTQYQVDAQNEHLQAVPELLHDVSGALLIMNSTQGQHMLLQAADTVQHIIGQQHPLDNEQIQLLANAVSSADLFFEQWQHQQPMPKTALQIGQSSIDQLARAVA